MRFFKHKLQSRSSESLKSSGSRTRNVFSDEKQEFQLRPSYKQSPSGPKSSKHLMQLKQKYNEIKHMANENNNLQASMR